MKRRQKVLLQFPFCSGKLRQRKIKKWLNGTWEIRGKARDLCQVTNPRYSLDFSSVITKPSFVPKLFSFWLSLVVFIYTKTSMLLQSYPPDFFFSVQKLICIYNYILHLMPHLRSKHASFQRQAVELQAGWADPSPSPAQPSQILDWVMGRTVMARRKAAMTSASINKFHSPWTQQGFISAGRIQKYIGWRKLGKLKMHSILPPLKRIPRGAQSV